MGRFARDGLSFEAPEGWLDVSIASFQPNSAPDPARICTLIVAKEPLAASESLQAHMQKKLMTVSKVLERFAYVDTRDGTLGGRPAIVIRFTWANASTRILQSLTATEIVAASARYALVVTTTSSKDDDEAHQRAFDRALASFELASALG